MKGIASTSTISSTDQGTSQEYRLAGANALPKPPVRVALYSHDTVGLGHFRRNLLLAQSLAESPLAANVLLIAATPHAHTFHMPDGVDCVTLPSVTKVKHGCYQARKLKLTNKEIASLRGEIISSTLQAFNPDVFIVDKVPRGVLNELVPALEFLRDRSDARCILGLRDVLDDPEAAQHDWHSGQSTQAIDRYYDQVWIYGDPAVYDLIQEYKIDPDTAAKMVYTGYLNPKSRLKYSSSVSTPAISELPVDDSFVLCAVGGGEDGCQLAEAFASAQLPKGLSGVLLTGPMMRRDVLRRIKRVVSERTDIQVIDFHPEPVFLVEKARRVIAMGGYNTLSEIVAFNKHSLIVPRTFPRREQMIRAKRFSELGLVDVLDPSCLAPDTLTQWLASSRRRCSKSDSGIEFGGLTRVRQLLGSLLDDTVSQSGSLRVASALV